MSDHIVECVDMHGNSIIEGDTVRNSLSGEILTINFFGSYVRPETGERYFYAWMLRKVGETPCGDPIYDDEMFPHLLDFGIDWEKVEA